VESNACRRWAAIDPEDSLDSNDRRRSWPRQAVPLALLVVLGVLTYAAIELLPPWWRSVQADEARGLGRRVAFAFLDGLLIAYGPALLAALGGTLVLAYRRSEGPLTPERARLLLLSVSVLLGLLGMETGAAVWRAWIHRIPKISSAISPANTTRTDVNVVRCHLQRRPFRTSFQLCRPGLMPNA
jgi:hypothetical protein